MNNEISGVAAITALCYLAGQSIKATPLKKKWVPVICGVFGVILGIFGLYAIPGFPASDPISAAAVGAVSGFAATGVNQTFQEFKGCPEKSTEKGGR